MAGYSDSAWSTTFFWEQDLRSLYMNGLLNSLLKPGIYNANMAVFATTGTGIDSSTTSWFKNKGPGVYLYLKRGTTFIFSNGYQLLSKDNTDYLTQDFENAGNFLIKSTVIQDTTVLLQAVNGQSASGRAGKALRAFFGSNSSPEWAAPGEIFITAQMNFNGEGALETQAGYDSVPTFGWALKTGHNFNDSIDDEEVSGSSSYDQFGQLFALGTTDTEKLWVKNFWFIDSATFVHESGWQHRMVPDGKNVSSQSESNAGPQTARATGQLDRISYLPVGRLLKNSDASFGPYVDDSGKWNTYAPQTWNQDYAFTGLGFPSYRQEMNFVYRKLRPSTLPVMDHNYNSSSGSPDPASKSGYNFDLSTLKVGNRLVSNNKVTATLEDPLTGPSYFTEILNEPSRATSNPYFLTDYSSKLNTFKAASYTLIFDFIYMLLAETPRGQLSGLPGERTEYMDSTNKDWLNTLFSERGTSGYSCIKTFSHYWTGGDGDIPGYLQITGLNWYKNFRSLGLPPNSSDYSPEIDNFIEYNIGTTDASEAGGFKLAVPLDVSAVNLDRFKDFLNKTDFLNKLIDGWRQTNPEYLQVKDQIPADTLIPLMMAFRPFKLVAGELESADSYSTIEGRVHPKNVFDFFNLDLSGTKVYTVNLQDQNLYTVLPIIQ